MLVIAVLWEPDGSDNLSELKRSKNKLIQPRINQASTDRDAPPFIYMQLVFSVKIQLPHGDKSNLQMQKYSIGLGIS